MLPKIQNQTMGSTLKKETVAANIISDSHTKGMLAKTSNINYKPYKSAFCPRNPHSPFGDFPSTHLKMEKYPKPVPKPVFEDSIAALAINKVEGKKVGTGGAACTMNARKTLPTPPQQISGAFSKRPIPVSEFRRFYDRGDLPVKVGHTGSINKLVWEKKVETLDYHHYLPIFFDGLREKMYPYNFLSLMGTFELLETGPEDKIFYCIPQLIIPIKTALNTRDSEIISLMLKVIQKLASVGPKVGEGLLPYYRQILPILNLYKTKNRCLGDKIEYNQRKQNNLGDLILETLEILERTGGEVLLHLIRSLLRHFWVRA